MELYILYRGTSKNRLKPVMTDSLHKVNNYRKALVASDKGGRGKTFHYDIALAPAGSTVWRKDRTNAWTGYNDSGPKIVR